MARRSKPLAGVTCLRVAVFGYPKLSGPQASLLGEPGDELGLDGNPENMRAGATVVIETVGASGRYLVRGAPFGDQPHLWAWVSRSALE